MKYYCRVVSEQFHALEWPDWERGNVIFSPRVPLKEAAGLLAIYDPTEELLQFKGPKLWHTMEPMWHSHYRRHPVGKKLVSALREDEWVYYANPVERYRVPVVTARSFSKTRQANFKERAVATVNYSGGCFWWMKRHTWLRNRMITCPLVDLYGSEPGWRQFSRFPYVWKKGLPSNFCGGKAPGADLHDPLFLEFLSRFKVYVCLENSYEPYWFTEKLVNAVRCGCIPVYHAHPTVRETFLKDAVWIDPKDFAFNPRRTIEYALAQDIHRIRSINDAWLDSGILENTRQDRVNEKVLSLMVENINLSSKGIPLNTASIPQ